MVEINGKIEQRGKKEEIKDICGVNKCVLPVQCPGHVREHKPITCHVNERVGVCCSTGRNHTGLNRFMIKNSDLLVIKNYLLIIF